MIGSPRPREIIRHCLKSSHRPTRFLLPKLRIKRGPTK